MRYIAGLPQIPKIKKSKNEGDGEMRIVEIALMPHQISIMADVKKFGNFLMFGNS